MGRPREAENLFEEMRVRGLRKRRDLSLFCRCMGLGDWDCLKICLESCTKWRTKDWV
jgi:hypothetical protein